MFAGSCKIENGISYVGHDLKLHRPPKKKDPESCRAHCKSAYPGRAKYFDWISPSFGKYANHCHCKTSNAGRRARDGVVAGNICKDKQGKFGA